MSKREEEKQETEPCPECGKRNQYGDLCHFCRELLEWELRQAGEEV